jgi:hypothetical protein
VTTLKSEILRLNTLVSELRETKELLSTENSKYMTEISELRVGFSKERNLLEEQLR